MSGEVHGVEQVKEGVRSRKRRSPIIRSTVSTVFSPPHPTLVESACAQAICFEDSDMYVCISDPKVEARCAESFARIHPAPSAVSRFGRLGAVTTGFSNHLGARIDGLP